MGLGLCNENPLSIVRPRRRVKPSAEDNEEDVSVVAEEVGEVAPQVAVFEADGKDAGSVDRRVYRPS